MATFLLATSDVHEAAALCDYLGGRLDGDDVVHVVGLDTGPEGDDPPAAGPLGGNAAGPSRDRADALNAVRSRLSAVATIEIADETVEPDDEPIETDDTNATAGAGEVGNESVDQLLAHARAVDADEIVLARGASGVAQLLEEAGRPVVVVPTL